VHSSRKETVVIRRRHEITLQYIRKFESIFETILGYESGGQVDEKAKGETSQNLMRINL
jgi:hypothetical protein